MSTQLRNEHKWHVFILATLVGLSDASAASSARTITISSPNERLRVTVSVPATEGGQSLSWSATFQGRQILTNCAVGLEVAGAANLFKNAQLIRERHRSIDDRVRIPFGKADHAVNRFHESRLEMETADRHRANLVFRCYDDAIAMRYELPGDALTSVAITEETKIGRAHV